MATCKKCREGKRHNINFTPKGERGSLRAKKRAEQRAAKKEQMRRLTETTH